MVVPWLTGFVLNVSQRQFNQSGSHRPNVRKILYVIQLADLPKNHSNPTATWRGHPFDRACRQHSIEHRLIKPNHPWTNGQVERMNRTLKETTVQRYYDETHDRL